MAVVRCRHGEDRDGCDACYADDCARSDLSRVGVTVDEVVARPDFVSADWVSVEAIDSAATFKRHILDNRPSQSERVFCPECGAEVMVAAFAGWWMDLRHEQRHADGVPWSTSGDRHKHQPDNTGSA